MNKEKLRKLIQEEGYEEISQFEWTELMEEGIICLEESYINEEGLKRYLYFKPKDNSQEQENENN